MSQAIKKTNIGAEQAARVAGAADTASSPDGDSGAAPTEAATNSGDAPPSPQVQYVAAKPVKGLRLGLWALWQAVARFFRRLFGRR